MNSNSFKVIGIVCIVLALVSVFVAVERYQANAANVRAIQQSPMGGMFQNMTGGAAIEPATPAATKYAVVFAVLFLIAGVVCLMKSAQGPTTVSEPMPGSSSQTMPPSPERKLQGQTEE